MDYLADYALSLTRSCMALAETPEVQAVSLFGRTIDWRMKGNSRSCIDLLTGKVQHTSRRKGAEYKPENHRKNEYLEYETLKAYFDGLEGKQVYRKPSVHCMIASLTESHRELLFEAFERDMQQKGRSEAKARVELHHIDCDAHNNSTYNILPCTPKEHKAIHKALNAGKSTYEALVIGLGEPLVHQIFGTDYFDFGDGGVFTASLLGESYIARMVKQLSEAELPANCGSIEIRTLHGKHVCLSISGLSVWELLSALYTVRAAEVKPYRIA